MHTLTHIGVIDNTNHTHIHFALTYMLHKQQQESELAYALWQEGELSLALHSATRADTLIYEMMHLKQHKSA